MFNTNDNIAGALGTLSELGGYNADQLAFKLIDKPRQSRSAQPRKSLLNVYQLGANWPTPNSIIVLALT
jgi:hypothetical protein